MGALWFRIAVVSCAPTLGFGQTGMRSTGSLTLGALRLPTDAAPGAVALVGGHWFDGKDFVDRTVYVIDDTLSDARPARVDSTIDLHSGYVVPPFADAHNHNVEFSSAARADAILAKYIREGVFYVQNPMNFVRGRAGLAGRVNVPAGVDVTFANAGITATGGHPTGLFMRNFNLGIYSAQDGEGVFLWTVDSLPDLDRKWPRILESKPDFIKTVLVYSEDYDTRRRHWEYTNWRGLDPKVVLPEIVRRAHAAGLRVMAHIESAADFHNALAAGVDEIGHMPGFRGNEQAQLPDLRPYLIADEDARTAASRGVPIVTTVDASSIDPAGADSLRRRQADSLHRANLRRLKQYGARIVVGSDNFRQTSLPEVMYLHSLGVFSNQELLKMWSESTPRAIFPQRRIGELRPGAEATFLVLDGNPLSDFQAVTRIQLRWKQGRRLVVAPT